MNAVYEYRSETGNGNLHDATALANVLAKEGWRLVAVDRAGYSYVAIFERTKEGTTAINSTRRTA